MKDVEEGDTKGEGAKGKGVKGESAVPDMKTIELNAVDLNAIAMKWQKKWEESGIFHAKRDSKKRKCYVLEMFPYPSASYLHMGHVRNYTIGDVFARFKRMNGFNVLYPMGYDSFGLPAENAAKKEGIHPREYTKDAIEKIIGYQKALGNSYDWSRVLSTCEPEYYRWNQYFFLKMLEKGLAYRKKAPVNWCPNCESVLADEEAEAGKCWRCGAEVEKKDLEQWFLKVTNYADELLDDLKNIEWPEKIKKMQQDWIGKSHGVEINFKIDGKVWPVFTTRPDTIFGVTFMVISAQHPKLLELADDKHKKMVEAFTRKCNRAKDHEEMEKLEKEGVFIGRYAINPVTNERIPVYAGNFVLADYGCGMVMGVPAHDQRDYEFAKKYNLPIKEVITPFFEIQRKSKNNRSENEYGKDGKYNKIGLSKELSRHSGKEGAYTGEGILVNSGEFTGMKSSEAIEKICDYIEKNGLGKKTLNYKIRDWMISRQRYWGTPIPIIYCEKCGIVPVPEKELPVILPNNVDFSAKENPLKSNREFVNTKCPRCGGSARRETDTMGGFVDSSWYFLRFCSPREKEKAFDREDINYWMPVDQYIGGAEHAVMHLIYARFFTKVLRDLGFVNFSEPFSRLFNQGIVYKSGHKMSKSFGNVVFQTEISEKYGIDTARLFLMFVANPDKQMEWSDEGVEGSYRIVRRIIALFNKIKSEKTELDENKINITTKRVTENIETFQYPKAIIAIIEAIDYFTLKGITREHYEILLKLFSPFCPHISEELWHMLRNKTFISTEKWPSSHEKNISIEAEELGNIFNSVRSDLRKIIQLAAAKFGTCRGHLKTMEVELIVAEAWKYAAVARIREHLEKTRNVKEIIRMMISDFKNNSKEVPWLVEKLIKNPHLIIKSSISQEDEFKFLEREKKQLEDEFDIKIKVESAEDSKEEKARQSIPGKPAIVLK